MSITTIYRCDNCGHEQQTKDQMWRVRVDIRPLSLPDGQTTVHSAEWCRKCAEAVHLLPNWQHEKAKEELPPPPTLEDLIRQIVREEAAA